jgi:hypothetical protein
MVAHVVRTVVYKFKKASGVFDTLCIRDLIHYVLLCKLFYRCAGLQFLKCEIEIESLQTVNEI